MLTRALESLSWDEAENAKGGCKKIENTKGGVWDQSGERGVFGLLWYLPTDDLLSSACSADGVLNSQVSQFPIQ